MREMHCGCCGRLLLKPEDNVDHGKIPYPNDIGVGTCKDCGGDPDSDDIKEQMGWEMRTFCEARFGILRGALSPEHQAKWDGMEYWKKAATVVRMVEKGLMI